MQQVIITDHEENGYTVEVQARPDLGGQTSTYREAVMKLIEAFSTLPESTEPKGLTLEKKTKPIHRSQVRGKLS